MSMFLDNSGFCALVWVIPENLSDGQLELISKSAVEMEPNPTYTHSYTAK
jgi:hypothetical protein